MEAIICDICDRVIKSPSPSKSRLLITSLSGLHSELAEFDLCEYCTNKLISWFRTQQEEAQKGSDTNGNST